MRLLHVINTLNPASGGTAETVKMFASRPGAEQSIATLDRPEVAVWPLQPKLFRTLCIVI